MKESTRKRCARIALALLGLLGSCGPPSRFGGIGPRAGVYVPGLPYFEMEVVSSRDGPESAVDVFVQLSNASLTFVKGAEGFLAPLELTVEVRHPTADSLVLEQSWNDTVRVADYSFTKLFLGRVIERRLPVPRGEFLVTVVLQDRNSGTRAVQSRGVTVYDQTPAEPVLGDIGLAGLRGGDRRDPAPALRLVVGEDSVAVVAPLYCAPTTARCEVKFVFAKLRCDTLPASPPYAFGGFGPPAMRGVDEEKRDTVMLRRLTLDSLPGNIRLQFPLPPRTAGVYLALLQVRVIPFPGGGRETSLTRARALPARPRDFPRPTTLDELTEALVYIAKEEEFNRIHSASSQEEKRERFDLFWLSLMKDEVLAANTIRQYYTRVQEANMFFTTFKEGWKTDRGMVYTVLGPPMAMENRVDHQVWSYTNADQDQANVFVFRRVTPEEPNAGFSDFVLDRQSYYDRIWIRAIERWRTGRAY